MEFSIYLNRLQDIETLAKLSATSTVSIEVRQYLQHVLTFLKMHRAVAGGVTPKATQHFELLARCLAPLHGLQFVTPSLVVLSAFKIYRHRLTLIEDAHDDRSIQYGSDLAAVTFLLDGVTPLTIIEDVIRSIEVPL